MFYLLAGVLFWNYISSAFGSHPTSTYNVHRRYETTSSPECEPVTLMGENGSFTSPNYPGEYGRNTECVWHIEAPEGSTIQLVISEIDIEPQLNCVYDALEIFDGPDIDSPRLAMICHRGMNSTTIISTANRLTAFFRSDKIKKGNGFVATYTVISCVTKNLNKGGDLKWFKFNDDPKTKSSNLKKALFRSRGLYSGLEKQSVTFNVQGKSKFTVKEAKISVKFASQVEFVFHTKKKGKNTAKKTIMAVKNSSKWSSFTVKHDQKIVKMSIQITWDPEITDEAKSKVSVKNLSVAVCLDG